LALFFADVTSDIECGPLTSCRSAGLRWRPELFDHCVTLGTSLAR
jgi:hypothetical protein